MLLFIKEHAGTLLVALLVLAGAVAACLKIYRNKKKGGCCGGCGGCGGCQACPGADEKEQTKDCKKP